MTADTADFWAEFMSRVSRINQVGPEMRDRVRSHWISASNGERLAILKAWYARDPDSLEAFIRQAAPSSEEGEGLRTYLMNDYRKRNANAT
jgi:hypothetical protein